MLIAMDAQSRTLAYQYDQNGNRTRVTFPDSTANYAAYSFDGLNRPLTAGASLPGWTKTYAYDARGELVSDVLSGSAGTTTWNRDPVGRLSSLARDVAGSASDITTMFAYNPASQIVSVARDNDAYVYTGRANGALSYAANGLNQYASVNSNAYCYDANGNLTADGVSVYLYDVENRLVEKHAAAGGTCSALSYAGALQASLRYDPMGRLYETSIGTAATTTRFLIDGDALVGEYDAVGNILRRYVHGADGKADDPIAWYEGPTMAAASLRFLHANQQGSITLTGDSAGNASRIFAYDEYGVARAGDTAALSPAGGARFLYTGQALVPELGMYYYKARIYAPQLGRFMQTDPIGYEDQNNLYGYLGNDPVDGTDPSGTIGVTCNVNNDAGTGPSGTCTTSNDGDNKHVNVTINYTRTVNGEKVTTTSKNSYSAGQVAYSEANGVSFGGVVAGQAKHDLGISLKFDKPFFLGLQVQNSAPQSSAASQSLSSWASSIAGSIFGGATPPAQSPIWKELRPYRDGIKTDGKNYYTYDRRHGEIEVFNKRGEHLGSKNAMTGRMEKPPVPGRRLDL